MRVPTLSAIALLASAGASHAQGTVTTRPVAPVPSGTASAAAPAPDGGSE